MASHLKITILGLSVTSSWGNGHATTYRHLMRALAERGHDLLFLERDVPWYATARDLPDPPWGSTRLYGSLDELRDQYVGAVRWSDLVIVGSYVPDGVEIGHWVTQTANGITAFYDIDTPVTLGRLARADCAYLSPELIAKYQLYLSFAGGPTLGILENRYHSPCARPLYCSVDPEHYRPMACDVEWDLGYLGTYSDDRQPTLSTLLVEPAREWRAGSFVVAGPQYPEGIDWPANVFRIEHLAPGDHASFYNRQRFTLNVTRDDMIRAGYSPSIRLFEAAACGTAIISDRWPGLEEFFQIGQELLVAASANEMARYLQDMSDAQRQAVGRNARRRVLAQHTAADRAAELEKYVDQVIRNRFPEQARPASRRQAESATSGEQE